MKKFLTVSMLIASAGAFAASNSSLVDLQYLPDQGTIFGSTNVGYLKYSDTVPTALGNLKVSSEGYLISQAVGYSVQDNLFLQVGTTYTNTKTRITGQSSTESSGMGDIELLGRYRLSGDEKRFDLLGAVSISPGDDEVKSDGDSNAYSGGHSITLGLEYGAKVASHQWAFRGTLTHDLEATEDNKQDDVKYKQDAHTSLGFQAQLLTILSEKCSIRNFVGVDFVEEFEDNKDNTTRGSTVWNAGADLQHLLSNDLLVRAGAAAMIPANGKSDVFVAYTLGADYQF